MKNFVRTAAAYFGVDRAERSAAASRTEGRPSARRTAGAAGAGPVATDATTAGSRAADQDPEREPRRGRRWSIGFGRPDEERRSVIERRTDDDETLLPRPSEDSEKPVAARSFSGRTLLAVLVLVVLVITIAPTVHRYFQQRAEIQSIQQSISELKDQQKDLQKQEDLWKNDDYARQQARERLYYVTPGETAYVVTGQSSSDHQAAGTSAEAETQARPTWGQSLWDSVATSSQ